MRQRRREGDKRNRLFGSVLFQQLYTASKKKKGAGFLYDPAVLFVAGFGAEAGVEGAAGVEGVPLVAVPAGGVDVEPSPALGAVAEAGVAAGLLPLLADLLPNFSWMARICSSTLGAGICGGGG